MKHSKLIAGFLLVAASFSACKKDNDVAEIEAPTITGLEIGPNNNKTAHPGGDLHMEAALFAAANMESVTLEINPKSGTGWKLNTVYTEGFAGLKNAEFHKHVDVPADAALGSYDLKLKVKDQNGKETTVTATLELTIGDHAAGDDH